MLAEAYLGPRAERVPEFQAWAVFVLAELELESVVPWIPSS